MGPRTFSHADWHRARSYSCCQLDLYVERAMMLLRGRHVELDKFRDPSFGFCRAWLMFFGTVPPGLSKAGVFYTEYETKCLAAGTVPASVKGAGSKIVEPALGNLPGQRVMARMHGSRT